MNHTISTRPKGYLILFVVFTMSMGSVCLATTAWFEVDPADAKQYYTPGEVITINVIADKECIAMNIGAIISDNGGTAWPLAWTVLCIQPYPTPCQTCTPVNGGDPYVLLEFCDGSVPFGSLGVPAGEPILYFEYQVPDLPPSTVITIDDYSDMTHVPPYTTSFMFADFSMADDVGAVQLQIMPEQEIVADVNWHKGGNPPSESWIIKPSRPSVVDIVSFSGPSDGFSNECWAEMWAGGYPTIRVYAAQRVVILWFKGPPPIACPMIVDPVCGLEGQFGPLAAGDWRFFNFCGEGAGISFSIEFDVSSLKVFDPNGGEELVAGSTQTISWADYRAEGNCPGEYILEYSTDNGESWMAIDSNSVGNSCTYEWVVPAVDSNQCLVRVSDANDARVYDTSDSAFTIFQCTLAGDVTGDCVVDLWDLAALAADWLKCGNPFDPDCGW